MTDDLRDEAEGRRAAALIRTPEGRPSVFIYRRDGDEWNCVGVEGTADHLEALREHFPEGTYINCVENRPTFGDVWEICTPDGKAGRYLTRWSRL